MTTYTAIYVHDTDDGQVEFEVEFSIEPGYDGRTDGYPTLPSVIDVEATTSICELAAMRADRLNWLAWFRDEYERNADFRRAVDACCLDAASEALIGSNER